MGGRCGRGRGRGAARLGALLAGHGVGSVVCRGRCNGPGGEGLVEQGRQRDASRGQLRGDLRRVVQRQIVCRLHRRAYELRLVLLLLPVEARHHIHDDARQQVADAARLTGTAAAAPGCRRRGRRGLPCWRQPDEPPPSLPEGDGLLGRPTRSEPPLGGRGRRGRRRRTAAQRGVAAFLAAGADPAGGLHADLAQGRASHSARPAAGPTPETGPERRGRHRWSHHTGVGRQGPPRRRCRRPLFGHPHQRPRRQRQHQDPRPGRRHPRRPRQRRLRLGGRAGGTGGRALGLAR
mmetsp:Transcript_462/g.1329  ORF Transcript_462/g.1329 Transcript_462/m.1329 type:complete len:292 (+) Transcript_462:418-1293(+)